MRNIFEYPQHLSLIITIVLFNIVASIWAEKKRGRLGEPQGSALEAIGFLLFILVVILHIIFIYCLPAAIIVIIIKYWIGGVEISAAFNVYDITDTILKVSLLFCLIGNLADLNSIRKRSTFLNEFLQSLVLLPLSYYVIMVVAWLLAKLITAVGNYDKIRIYPEKGLFSVPSFLPGTFRNCVVICTMILISAVISYFLTEYRRPSNMNIEE